MIPVYTCAGGTAFGLQGMGGGISIGSATPSEVCEAVFMAHAAADLGDPHTAQEVLCSLAKIREARLRAGHPCWADTPAGRAQVAQAGSLPRPSPEALREAP